MHSGKRKLDSCYFVLVSKGRTERKLQSKDIEIKLNPFNSKSENCSEITEAKIS